MEQQAVYRLAALLILPLAAACSSTDPPGELLRSAKERAAPQAVNAPDVVQAASDTTGFALDLERALQTSSPKGNAFFSPWSISLALSMTYAGARGDTAAQMAKALHFTLPDDRLHAAFNAIDQALHAHAESPARGSPIELRIANALFAQKGHAFLSGYLDTLAKNYGAGVSLLDFVQSPDPSRVQINDWVEDITDGHIKDLLKPGLITKDTRLVLTNAVYMNAAWDIAFDASRTTPSPFHRAPGDDVSVPTMNAKDVYGNAATDGYVAVELPYVNHDMTMLIVMPTQGTLDTFVAGLDAQALGAISGSLHKGEIILSLPKFTLHSSFDMKATLQGMGMTAAFSDDADLSGMDGKRDLRVADVVHQAFVDVSEAGTEAAAATAVVVTTRSASPAVEVDHPFLFFIRDVPTGAVLFAGRVVDPSAH